MKIFLSELATKYKQTAQLFDSGSPIDSIYLVLFKKTHYKAVPSLSLTENLRRSNCIPSFDILLIESAEKTGKLPSVLQDLSTYYTEQNKFRNEIFSKSNYTLVLLGIMFTIPLFTKLLKGEVSEVATFTKISLIWVIGISIYIKIKRNVLSKKVKSNRNDFFDFFSRVPFISQIYWNFQFHWLYTILYFFTDIGSGPISAIEFYVKQNKSSPMGKKIKKKILYLKKTSSIAKFFELIQFPEDDLAQIEVGEKTGTLPSAFTLLKNIYKEKCKDNIEMLSFWIPKIIYFFFLIFAAYSIIKGFTDQLNEVNQIIDEI